MGTYTHSTSHEGQGGIAYQPRGSRRRSLRSTQPLGVTPETEGRGTGGRQVKGGRARDVQQPEPEWLSSTGEPCALKGACTGSGRGRRKRTGMYLAGGLLYSKTNRERAVWKTLPMMWIRRKRAEWWSSSAHFYGTDNQVATTGKRPRCHSCERIAERMAKVASTGVYSQPEEYA